MRTDGLCGSITCDAEYPPRVAFSLLTRLLEDFSTFKPDWVTETRNEAVQWPQLESDILKYQDPANADQIMKIQRSLDETRDVLHNTIGTFPHGTIRSFTLLVLSCYLSSYEPYFPLHRVLAAYWSPQIACCRGARSWRTWWSEAASSARSPSCSTGRPRGPTAAAPSCSVQWRQPSAPCLVG